MLQSIRRLRQSDLETKQNNIYRCAQGAILTHLVVHGECAAVRDALALVVSAASAGAVDVLLCARVHGEVTLCVTDLGSNHTGKSQCEEDGRKELHVERRYRSLNRRSIWLLDEG